MNRFLLAGLAGILTLSACDSNDPDPVAIDGTTLSNVPADLVEGRDPETGATISANRFTLIDLDAGTVVLRSDEEDRSDSLSTVWDIGLRGTEVIVNGGTSGPGDAAAQLVVGTFDALLEAPADGYRVDGTAECPTVQTQNGPQPGPSRAVCDGSGNGWYTYNPFPGNQGGYITPTAGRTLVVRNAESQTYSKLQFVSYYQGNPDPATITQASPGRYYTIRFATQPDGSRSFETTDD